MSKRESKHIGNVCCSREKGKIERGIKAQKIQVELKVSTKNPPIGYIGHEIKPRKAL